MPSQQGTEWPGLVVGDTAGTCGRVPARLAQHVAPLCWNERPALLLRTCKTSASDELMMMCGAQRALQGS